MNFRKFITSLVLFSFSLLYCSAQTSSKVTVMASMGSRVFTVTYKTSVPDNVRVTILNDKGERVFEEFLPKTLSFSRPYNFIDQPFGEFTIMVEDKEGKSNNTVSNYLKKVESAVEVGRIVNTPNKYLLTIANTESDQIMVRVLDHDRTVLSEEYITVSGRYAVVYNLNSLKGAPIFEVTGSNGVLKTFNFE